MTKRWTAGLSLCALMAAGCGNGTDTTAANAAVADNIAAAPMPEANDAAPGMTATSGQQYVDLAGASDLYEIEAARLARQKAQNSEVRDLAQMIEADHQRSTERLTAAAGEAAPPLRATPQLNPEQQANLEALRSAEGAAFDAEYLRQQVMAHEQALGLVEGYARSGDVAPLREHAASVAGPIRQHLERARELAGGQ